MTFIETHVFTKIVKEILSLEEYRAIQNQLFLQPDLGELIPGCKGLRKSRHRYRRTGKRGGLRLIYYYDRSSREIYMLFLYEKSGKDDLTPDQKKTLAKLVEEQLK
jgi:mRNA-degrading endonuclease RelE of RelBE toxin-antitoxin system